jgi:hypothetical protein
MLYIRYVHIFLTERNSSSQGWCISINQIGIMYQVGSGSKTNKKIRIQPDLDQQ